jgi:hypothetical protein
MQVLDSRLNRASRVAAYMEKQIKEAKPNAKIDYNLLQEVEPSTQLLAALLSRNTEIISDDKNLKASLTSVID